MSKGSFAFQPMIGILFKTNILIERQTQPCKRTELDTVHIRNIIAGTRNFDADELAMVMNLIKKLRERIRQIEAKALCRLRHPARSSELRGFLDFDL